MLPRRVFALVIGSAILVAGCNADQGPPRPTVTSECSVPPNILTRGSQRLPDDVAEKRMRIMRAAAGCNYEALAALTSDADQGFTFSYGTGEDPASYWEEREREGEPVLRYLVRMLQLPYGTIGGDEMTYVWPAAAGEGPSSEDRAAVEEEFRDESDNWFGDEGFLGPRVGITADGEWIYYVAGD